MIKHEIDEDHSILKIYPTAPLSEQDFLVLNQSVNAMIEKKGLLRGIIIESEFFPGWESLGAMIKHFQFIKDNHKKVNKIALVTQSKLGNIVETIISHFVAAKLKKFQPGNVESAKKWIMSEE